MIVGSSAFVEKARIYRKMFGGGMRQVGVLAAAGRIALEESPKRLAIDHQTQSASRRASRRFLHSALIRQKSLPIS
jgi:threonine aldolase